MKMTNIHQMVTTMVPINMFNTVRLLRKTKTMNKNARVFFSS